MRRPRRSAFLFGACLAGFLVLLVGPLAAPALGSNLPSAGASSATTLISISLSGGVSTTTAAPGFWGADVRPYYALGPAATSAYDGTGLSAVRWPGGAVADRLNVTSDRIYNDNGTYSTPPVNESTFVTWCRSVGCTAVIGLPGEIDSPSTAAFYVQYTEQTLHFTPAYWEIGNEPALWTHFGASWARWNATQTENATPPSYAQLVHTYIAAIRAVDPTSRFLGLPGVGQGAYGETGWIRATVALNGPNLSGVAIHVYPAGGTVSGATTLAGFYSTLNGSSSLSARLPADRIAVAAACPRCAAIPVLVTELGSGTQGGAYNSYMSGFPDEPFIATEAIQALSLNLSQIDLFALQANYGGSLLGANGTPSLTNVLYDQILSRVGPVVTSTIGSPAAAGLAGVTARSENGSVESLLVANTNTTREFTLQAQGAAASAGYVSTLVSWNSTGGTPTTSVSLGGPIPALLLPPESVALLIVSDSPSVVAHGVAGAHPAPWWGAGSAVPGIAAGLAIAVPLLARRSVGHGVGA
jgi:hypothetical protein